MRMAPSRLNTAIAALFMVGSASFVLGSVPAYVNAVGGIADSVTYFVGSIFFTVASYCQLLQSQSPQQTDVGARQQHQPAPVRLMAWLPHDKGWVAAATQFPGTLLFNISTFAALAHNATVREEDHHVWRPDFFGSTLFLIASAYAIVALGRVVRVRPRSVPWWIAWLNMLGSLLFMWSAVASYVLPTTGDLINSRASIMGTLLGAICFLIGAALMLPGWRRAVRDAEAETGTRR
jgi:hypothetical protein